MRQSQSYRRNKVADFTIDPNSYDTYRKGVALRILRRLRGKISKEDAWQLAAIPAFFLWLFRKPRAYFKKKKVDGRLRRRISGTNSRTITNR